MFLLEGVEASKSCDVTVFRDSLGASGFELGSFSMKAQFGGEQTCGLRWRVCYGIDYSEIRNSK